MTSGTLGWKITPSTMPITSAAMPIMPDGLLSSLPLRPDLLGVLDIPARSGGEGQTAVGDGHADEDAIGRLQQPEAVHAAAAVERVPHGVRRADRDDLVGAAGGGVVDQDRTPGLAD